MPESLGDHVAPAASTPGRPRFSWPMRLFLAFVLFDMVFRSLSVLAPSDEWMEELQMQQSGSSRLPRRLPTREEFGELAEGPDGSFEVFDDVMRSLDSIWVFLKPWPGAATRANLGSGVDWAKFAFCWINSRYEFVENIVGINQEWVMFPNAHKKLYVTRAELTFADGSKRTVRQLADPEDLTCFSHWFQKKTLGYELRAKDGKERGCLGYCNLLAHRYSQNDHGSPLITIQLYEVFYNFTPPDADPAVHLRQQSGPPDDQVYPVYFVYDVVAKKGGTVDRN